MTPHINHTVSILMTVFNEEQFLAPCLDSVLNQNYPHLEIIVIDDGSTDGTFDILEHYTQRDSRIKCFRRSRQGRARSLNDAFKQSTGGLIAVVDSDDIVLQDRIEKQVEYFSENLDIGLVASYFEQIDPKGNVIKVVDNLPLDPDVLWDSLLNQNHVCHGTLMARREVYEKTGGYREVFQAAIDYDFILRAIEETKIAILPEILYQYRFHASDYMAHKRLLQLQMRTLAQELAKERRQHKQDPLEAYATIEEKKGFIATFLKNDRVRNKKRYANILNELGKKFIRLDNPQAAAIVFRHSFALHPVQFQAPKFLSKLALRRLTQSVT